MQKSAWENAWQDMIKKLIQHDKSAGLGDFDEESEKNEKSLQPGASTDVILGDYAEVIEENIMEYYASVEEEVSRVFFHIQYFKYQFGKFVINERDSGICEKRDL